MGIAKDVILTEGTIVSHNDSSRACRNRCNIWEDSIGLGAGDVLSCDRHESLALSVDQGEDGEDTERDCGTHYD